MEGGVVPSSVTTPPHVERLGKPGQWHWLSLPLLLTVQARLTVLLQRGASGRPSLPAVTGREADVKPAPASPLQQPHTPTRKVS